MDFSVGTRSKHLEHIEKEFNKYVQKTQRDFDKERKELDFKNENLEKLKKMIDTNEEKVKKREKQLEIINNELSEKKNHLEIRSKTLDEQAEDIEKKYETILKIDEEQKIMSQRFREWQKQIEKTGGFSKFPLRCSSCGEIKFIDLNDRDNYEKIKELFVNDMVCGCIKK